MISAETAQLMNPMGYFCPGNLAVYLKGTFQIVIKN
jgi:hypothetical protein